MSADVALDVSEHHVRARGSDVCAGGVRTSLLALCAARCRALPILSVVPIDHSGAIGDTYIDTYTGLYTFLLVCGDLVCGDLVQSRRIVQETDWKTS